MPTRNEIYSLAIAANCDQRTVRRWYDGETLHGATEVALKHAAKKLKIDPPKAEAHASAS